MLNEISQTEKDKNGEFKRKKGAERKTERKKKESKGEREGGRKEGRAKFVERESRIMDGCPRPEGSVGMQSCW